MSSEEEDECTCCDSDVDCDHTRDCDCGQKAREATDNCPVHYKVVTWQIYGGHYLAESFPSGAVASIGRGHSVDIYVHDPFASRVHAELTFKEDYILFANKSTTKPTYYCRKDSEPRNEEKDWIKSHGIQVRECIKLYDGDTFCIGNGLFRVRKFNTYHEMMDEPMPHVCMSRNTSA